MKNTILLALIVGISATSFAMSNDDFAKEVKKETEVISKDKAYEKKLVDICRNLSDARRSEDPRCVALSQVRWKRTAGSSNAKF